MPIHAAFMWMGNFYEVEGSVLLSGSSNLGDAGSHAAIGFHQLTKISSAGIGNAVELTQTSIGGITSSGFTDVHQTAHTIR